MARKLLPPIKGVRSLKLICSLLSDGAHHFNPPAGRLHPGISHVPAGLSGLVELDMQTVVPLLPDEVHCDVQQMASEKRGLFSSLWEFTGPSKKLSLLELGCGMEANSKFYLPRMPGDLCLSQPQL